MARRCKLEKGIREVEGMNVVIHGPKDVRRMEYGFNRAAPGYLTIKRWARLRLPPGIAVEVIKDGETLHGRTIIKNARE